MKPLYSLFIILVMSALFFTSCKKDDEDVVVPVTAPGKGLITPKGTPAGEILTKEIGQQGGSIVTPDGKLSIEIPQGALAATQVITIQPITNTNVAGKSLAYRITPHGLTFKKEIKLTFAFSAEEAKRTIPEALGIAYQDSSGIWQALGGKELDKINKKLTIGTTHFSDWSLFESFWIDPWSAHVELCKMIDLKVVTVDPDLMAPLPKGETRPIDQPYDASDEFIKTWDLDGEGILGGGKNFQTYQAPNQMPAKNPVAVRAELNLPVPGKLILVSNLTVGNPPQIGYLQVDEEKDLLYIYGKGFGWVGVDEPLVTIDGVKVLEVTSQLDFLITCKIIAEGKGSSGPVVVNRYGIASSPHVLNEWNGIISYERPCAGKNGGSLYQKTDFHIRLRGDANPDETIAMPEHLFVEETKLNIVSSAKYEAGGMGQTYTNVIDFCGTENVQWSLTQGFAPYTFKDISGGINFTSAVKVSQFGFKLWLDFFAEEVIATKYSVTYCTGGGNSKTYKDGFAFDFNSVDDELNLSFKEHSQLAGGNFKKPTGAARGLSWSFEDAKENIEEATLTWGEIPAKYPDGIIIE